MAEINNRIWRLMYLASLVVLLFAGTTLLIWFYPPLLMHLFTDLPSLILYSLPHGLSMGVAAGFVYRKALFAIEY